MTETNWQKKNANNTQITCEIRIIIVLLQKILRYSLRNLIMLTKFKIENFRSIKKEVTLCFDAVKGITDKIVGMNNSGPLTGYTSQLHNSVLNSIVFYGANSSGKTNFIKALSCMKSMIIHSVRLNDNESLPFDPFLLSAQRNDTTLFEICYIEKSVMFRYGFRYNQTEIVEEWLYMKKPNSAIKQLLYRKNNNISIDETAFEEGKSIKDDIVKLNKNRLFISLSAQLGGNISKDIIDWFMTKVSIVMKPSGESFKSLNKTPKDYLKETSLYKQKVIEFMNSIDSSIKNISIQLMDVENIKNRIPAEILDFLRQNPPINIYSNHNVYNESGGIVKEEKFEFETRESSGTNKILNLAGPIIEALDNGGVLCIDEFEAQLHPILSKKIVCMFNDTSINSKGAQLVITTHDTNLIGEKMFRRDQIILVEKDNVESSNIHRLLDIKLEKGQKPRNDSNFEKNYLEGRYGAIPDTSSPKILLQNEES